MTNYTVALAFDSGIFSGARMTIFSILLTNPSTPIDFVVLNGGISQEQKTELEAMFESNNLCSIRWINFDSSCVKEFVSHHELTHMAYARILLPELLDSDSCLYVDADFLILSEIGDLMDHDDSVLMAAVLDGEGCAEGQYPWHEGRVNSPFVNTGLMWMNLARWRTESISAQILDFLAIESGRCRSADQNAINWILRDRIKIMEGHLNSFGSEIDDGVKDFIPGKMNIHYASGMKPWKRPLPTLSHISWRYMESLLTGGATKLNWTARSMAKYACYYLKARKKVVPLNASANRELGLFKRYVDNLKP